MPLFHPRIIEKHINSVSFASPAHLEIIIAWAENLVSGIYNSETKNDGQFIQRILVELLGYKESNAGSPWTVQKNQPVGKGNVDVALGSFTADNVQVIAPFELKGAKTRDLDTSIAGRNKSPVQQAWEYAMDAKGAKWVLVSNYREIRLYAVGYGCKDYEKFDLTQLARPEEYKRFILLLSADNLLSGRTFNLLKESENKDKEITNKLYQDYKTLRSQMIETLKTDNPAIPVLDIIQHTQIILDRILFVSFAEDRGLLPKNTLKTTFETRNYFIKPLPPIWENFKGLFNAIDEGSSPLNITGYNGGLFAGNEQLNNLIVSDNLCGSLKKIGEYDFDSDVSVNILGHIFEQSITDLEEIKAQASGAENFDKKKSKRKKDGIFYTPSYITSYIVEQAVGGWLADRKAEIGFDKLPELADDDYASIKIVKKAVRYNTKIEQHIKAWEAYKHALSNIKVLDPACGSGAFLNEVFDYLLLEGQAVNNELATLNGGQAELFRWDAHILSNNIYGVDINRESVEITKLSLWLKTASRGEKLTYLDNNIKCGNSLIDDPLVAGDLAFSWEKEFADIMSGGGFDVVVGNPPWGAEFSEKGKKYIKSVYLESSQGKVDSYRIFIQKACLIIKDNAYVSYITPNTFLYNLQSTAIRKFLIAKIKILDVVELRKNIFSDAPDVVPVLFVFKNVQTKDYTFSAKVAKSDAKIVSLKDIEIYMINNNINLKLIGIDKTSKFNLRADKTLSSVFKKLKDKSVTLSKHFNLRQGTKIIGEKGKETTSLYTKSMNLLNKPWEKAINGRNIAKYSVSFENYYVKRSGELHSLLNEEIVYGEKIYFQRMRKISLFPRIVACYDNEGMHGLYTCSVITNKTNKLSLKYIVALLNSKLINLWYQSFDTDVEIKLISVGEIPIIESNTITQKQFAKKTEIMLTKNKELHELSHKFLALLKAEFSLDKFGNKLEQWYTLNFAEFMAELSKKKKILSLAQKAQWMEHFEKQKSIAVAIKSIIDTTDCEIDQMVYELYGLTNEEIAILEGGK